MRKIESNGNGFRVWDDEDLMTFDLHYNSDGVYRGQTQDDFEGSGTIFLSAEMINGVPCINGVPASRLSEEEMDEARQEHDRLMSKFRRVATI